jgi:hypothetical protein
MHTTLKFLALQAAPYIYIYIYIYTTFSRLRTNPLASNMQQTEEEILAFGSVDRWDGKTCKGLD